MNQVLRNWRPAFLLVLLVGPVLAYLGFGVLWLREHGWLWVAGGLWVASGVLFAFLAARWTRTQSHVLPPIDWDAPETFSKVDRDAWALVEAEAERGDSVSLEALTEFDLYIDTGRRLARALAEHYHPLSAEPLQLVPVVDLLTALELAAEDLSQLCRQVPGGDMLTPSHWKKAVQVAGYIQKANDIYSFLLPIFSPVSGLARLGAQQWMVKPAWRDMQQNLLRWFFRAFVNRLGTHLIELYSGRLAIGAAQYRRLTRRGTQAPAVLAGAAPALTIAVAGARGAGKSRLIAAVESARGADLALLKARLEGLGIDPAGLDGLRQARWVEAPGYTATPGGETAPDRATRRDAVAAAVEADLLVLVSDARRDTTAADAAFAQAWDRWFVEHPAAELPPALCALSAVDHADLGGPWKPPHQWSNPLGPREAAVRARLDALRSALPPSVTEIVPVGLPADGPQSGVVEALLPALVSQLHRPERASTIRQFNSLAARSKAGRLLSQVKAQGQSLWKNLRAPGPRRPNTPGAA